jgi:outer membrane protein assembly factor BamB
VAGAGVVLACAPKSSPVYAVKAGGNGALKEADLAWVSQDREISSDVSTPLFYKEHFYILNSDKRNLSCVEPATGKVLWTGSLQSKAKVEASPTGADDKIYVMNHRGDVFVAQAGNEFKLLHTTSLGDEDDKDLRSSIAVSQGNLFIRTGKKLYCIGTTK